MERNIILFNLVININNTIKVCNIRFIYWY